MTLTVTDCAKTFADGTRALKPASFTLETGGILGLLGPSGCGKTTLLRIIAGLETPDPGARIAFDGEDVTRLAVERRRIGMVFQSYALFPNMSVAGNVGYGLRMQGLPRAEIDTRVAEVLALCRLEALAARDIAALSGGQRQRVALARAIAPRPRALLLDEPLSALDAALREALRDELAELLRAFAITAILVTHDQHEAMAIADRIAVMEAGRIRQIGSPQELYRRPADAFVATFVGDGQRLGRIDADGRLALAGQGMDVPGGVPGQTVFVRAEDVRPAPGGRFPARLGRVTFLGAQARLDLTLADGTRLAALVAGRDLPEPGATLAVDLDPASLLVVTDPSA